MKIVIDMQGAQTESRYRGIGRYALSFAQAVARNRGDHEVFLALNGLFLDTIDPIRDAFVDLLPQNNIRIWTALGPVKASDAANASRRCIAEIAREAFLRSLNPDILHVTSLFEGFWDDAVTSIGTYDHNTPVSVSLYDLIPLLNRQHYLDSDPEYASYYDRKIASLRRADLLLAISHYSMEEGRLCLGIQPNRIINISTAADPSFQPIGAETAEIAKTLEKLGISRPFVLYTGGSDQRKNLSRLVEAWCSMPTPIKSNYQLLMAGKMHKGDVQLLKDLGERLGLSPDSLLFIGYVTDDELIQLYRNCTLYVFPSWHEGFGLPALEAMACGAAVIGSCTASLPEVIGLDEALFDPFNSADIARKIYLSLTNPSFRQKLKDNGQARARLFSWDQTAQRAIKAWEALHQSKTPYNDSDIKYSFPSLLRAWGPFLGCLSDTDLDSLANHSAQNQASGVMRQALIDVTTMLIHPDGFASRHTAATIDETLKQTIQNVETNDYHIRLIYRDKFGNYRYYGDCSNEAQNHPLSDFEHSPIRWQAGDLLIDPTPVSQLSYESKLVQNRLQIGGMDLLRIPPINNETSCSNESHGASWFDALTVLLHNHKRSRQLLVDISELVKHDAKSGIQRVVRSILLQWLKSPPHGYRVEPVYASTSAPYRYARHYLRQLGLADSDLDGIADELVEISPGDVFISLDLQHQVAPAQKSLLQSWRALGVTIWSVVYDLLPLQFPDCFLDTVHEQHQAWLETITEFDGAACISKAVASELTHWLQKCGRVRVRPLSVGWFHLGADMEASAPTHGYPADREHLHRTITSRMSFLMVSTVEPRKGHKQVLDGFEELFNQGIDVNLVIVGKQGWRVDDLAQRIRCHPEYGKRLLWLEGISDEFLNEVYAACTCLIVASKGEGFGLPLIEAAQHRLPIIARDLPVLREVAGEHAFYFDGHRAEDIAHAVKHWMSLYEMGQHPCSTDMPWLTWKESAEQLLRVILPKDGPHTQNRSQIL